MAQNKGRRKRKTSYTTSSGKSIKLNRSLSDQRQAKKAEKAAARALYLSTLPKDRWKRLLYRLRPDRLYHYWFSKQGALMAAKLVGLFIVASFLFTIALFAYYRKDLPQIKDISGDNLGGSVSYYDRTGTVLLFQDYNGVKRVPVAGNQISLYMKEATVAIEDKNFYKEGAFDVRGILRAGVHDVFGGGGSLQGGSTITQQLVKLNENWTDDRTVTRKIKELILAVEVERAYSKSEILTGYLNIAPYGGVDYGVQSASEDYFREPASQLSLAQAAMLAAIPQAPSYYSPYASTQFNPASGNTFSAQALLDREQYILNLMAQQHYITQAQANAAAKVNVLAEVQPAESKYGNIQDPYFVLVAKQQLENQFGNQIVSRGGLKVITTMDVTLQNDANQDIANNVDNVSRYKGDDEAMVGEDVKTGQILALVGGEDFNNTTYGQINFANTNVLPGSSVKPFVYSTLINNNTDVGAGSVLYDVQQPIIAGGTDYYPCTNKARPTADPTANCLWDYDYNYPGSESLRYALAGSRNVPAIKAVLSEDPTDTSPGHTKSIDLFQKTFDSMMGDPNGFNCYVSGANILTADQSQTSQCYASAGIGDGAYDHIDEQVNGDSTLARMGQEIPETYILNVSDASGKVLYQWTQPKANQVIKPDTAYIINNILSDPKASYLPTSYKFQNYNGWDIAVKTGTQNNNFDGLMTAWTTQFAVVSWVGNHTGNVSLVAGGMEYLTEPLTRTWIEQALNNSHDKPVNWTQPSDIKVLPAYVQRNHVGLGSIEPGPSTDLFPSWYRGSNGSSSSQSTTIDKVSGYLATSCTPDLAKDTVGGANDATFSADIFYPKYVENEQALEGGPAVGSSAQTDNVHNCNDTPPSFSSPPSATCTTASGCSISFSVAQGTHPLSGGTYTTAPAGTVSLQLNGQVIQTIQIPTDQSSAFSDTVSYTPSGTVNNGSLTATVVDSVLDSTTSASTSLTYLAAAGPSNLTFNAGMFSWSGTTGDTFTITDPKNNDVSGCTNVSGTSCMPSGALLKGVYTLTDTNTDLTTTYNSNSGH